jgi:hypothetical protein
MKSLKFACAEVNGLTVLASLSALGLTAIFPSTGGAEGAVRLLDCSVARVCNAAGACEPGSGEVAFRMEPVDASADGSGRYSLSYGDTRAEMQALSNAGPFVWTVGTERHTLLASSDTEFLWHRLTLDPAPRATIRFLTCAFRQ